MYDFKVFHLRVCFILFLNAGFSNAMILEIWDPNEEFAYTAAIDVLYVKRPKDGDFNIRSSAKQMFLSLHDDWSTFSFHETGASFTYFSFSESQVDFESFHSQTMAFSVAERHNLWQFRCIFAANKITLDTLYSYLSVFTAQGLMRHWGDILRVQLYIGLGPMRNPIIRNVEDLKPARFYDQNAGGGKVFSVTPRSVVNPERRIPRFVFRTNKFRVERIEDKVVLNLSGFEKWFYIFYFQCTDQAVNFVEHITDFETSPDVALDIPANLLSYLEPDQQVSQSRNDRDLSRNVDADARPDDDRD